MDKSCLPPDNVPQGIAAVRDYRRERAAMRTELRTALRAARAGLRTQRAATQCPPTRSAMDTTQPDTPVFVVPSSSPSAAPASAAPVIAFAAPSDTAEPSVLMRLLQTDVAPAPPHDTPPEAPNEMRAEASDEVQPEAAAESEPESVVPTKQSMPNPERPHEPPPSLARLGFGIGMSARLNQLGIHDTEDLAAVNAALLREALGEISRLVDVEAWVAQARALMASR